MVSRLMVVTFAPLLAGCATGLNTLYYTPAEGGNQVYGGVKLDALLIKASVAGHSEQFHDTPLARAWVATLATVDLPLSAVADTLTLPITVPATLLRDDPVPNYSLD
jgi:uncharacterized protein YceK